MKILSIILGLICVVSLTGQTVSNTSETATIQPTVMVIPFTVKGISLRDSYERNDLVRIAVTKIKEGFDNRGVNTIDLRAKLKQTANTSVLDSDQAENEKDDIIKNSGADIYVEVEASKDVSSTGNSATVILTAFDAYSGESFANKVAVSPKFYTDNFDKLVEKASEKELDNFLNTIQSKFTDIIINGRSIVMNIGIEDGSNFNMESEFGSNNDFLSELIENWVQSNAFKNYYHLQGVTSNKIIFDIVKIPLKDDKGNNFRTNSFTSDFRKFLNTINLTASTTQNGNVFVITIKQKS